MYYKEDWLAARCRLEAFWQNEIIDRCCVAPTFSPQYIPAYRKIQAAGKRLYLLAEPHEIEPLLEALSPVGLFLCTHASGEEDADALLKRVARLSAGSP